jgi:large subunit ribosomal protein L29
MTGITAKDLRGNEPDELRRTLRKLEEDLFKHRMKKVTNQLENTMLIRRARRDIARVNTVLGDKLRVGPAGAPASKRAPTPAASKET